MERSKQVTWGDAMTLFDRLAGAPISWGVCEVPGWGRQLPPARVLSEMAELGLVASELGPAGYLGSDATAIRGLLDNHGLRAVGGFVPLVLHDPEQRDQSHADAVAVAELLSGVGAEVFVTAVVVDADWSPRVPLDEAGWHAIFGGLARVDKLCEDVGLTQVVHPHVGTLVETADDVGRVLAGSDVRWCLDTGHLAVGGADPFAFARDHVDRIGHVHLKDVRLDVARSLRAGELSLKDATERGLFCPLGQGDVPVADIVSQLEAAGYPGWYVLEQDTAIAGGDPAPGHGPVDDVRASIEFLRTALATGLHPLTDANDLDKTRQGGTDT